LRVTDAAPRRTVGNDSDLRYGSRDLKALRLAGVDKCSRLCVRVGAYRWDRCAWNKRQRRVVRPRRKTLTCRISRAS
jgi:hypothetical protein